MRNGFGEMLWDRLQTGNIKDALKAFSFVLIDDLGDHHDHDLDRSDHLLDHDRSDHLRDHLETPFYNNHHDHGRDHNLIDLQFNLKNHIIFKN